MNDFNDFQRFWAEGGISKCIPTPNALMKGKPWKPTRKELEFHLFWKWVPPFCGVFHLLWGTLRELESREFLTSFPPFGKILRMFDTPVLSSPGQLRGAILNYCIVIASRIPCNGWQPPDSHRLTKHCNYFHGCSRSDVPNELLMTVTNSHHGLVEF